MKERYTDLNGRFIRRFLSFIFAKFHAEMPTADYLEIGAGDLRYQNISERPGWRSVYSDFEARSPDISLLADAHSLPFSSGTFDIVMMTEVGEHLRDLDLAISEISRVLKSGGVLILTMPFNYALHEIPSDYVRMTEFGLDRQLQLHGLRLETFERRGDGIAILLTISNHLISGAFEAISRKRLFCGIGVLFKAINQVMFGLLCEIYFHVGPSRRLRLLEKAGENLTGVGGHLQLWNLGCNMVFRKIQVRSEN